MAVLRQAVLTQQLHHFITLGCAYLQHHANLFIEQCFDTQLITPCADLRRPVLAVAMFGAAVADAVTFGHQQIDVQRHANVAGKCHLTDGGKQPAVAAVVVGQNQIALAQGVDGLDQLHQILRLLQVRRFVTHLPQRLRQHAASHATQAASQIDQ